MKGMDNPMEKSENGRIVESMRERIEGNPVNQELKREFPRDLHKEIWGHLNKSPDKTLYRWWWELMRASADFPAVRDELASSPKSQTAITKTEAQFGALGNDFSEWWDKDGVDLFAENGVPLVSVLMPMPDDEAFKKANGVVVMIPLDISRQLILKQLNIILKAYHKGGKLKRHAASTSKIRIFPRQMYPDTDYATLIAFWRAKQSDLKAGSEKAWWEIYCDATNDEKLREEIKPFVPTERNEETIARIALAADVRLKLGKQAETLYQQADVLMKNAIRGEFPRDDGFQAKKRATKKTA